MCGSPFCPSATNRCGPILDASEIGEAGRMSQLNAREVKSESDPRYIEHGQHGSTRSQLKSGFTGTSPRVRHMSKTNILFDPLPHLYLHSVFISFVWSFSVFFCSSVCCARCVSRLQLPPSHRPPHCSRRDNTIPTGQQRATHTREKKKREGVNIIGTRVGRLLFPFVWFDPSLAPLAASPSTPIHSTASTLSGENPIGQSKPNTVHTLTPRYPTRRPVCSPPLRVCLCSMLFADFLCSQLSSPLTQITTATAASIDRQTDCQTLRTHKKRIINR